MTPACTNQPLPNEMVGAPCEECGHSNVLHPGPGNPALDACLACQLLGGRLAPRKPEATRARLTGHPLGCTIEDGCICGPVRSDC